MIRTVGSFKVNAVGFGCMNLNHGYGHFPSETEAQQTLRACLSMGYDFFDTATLYGGGSNEELVGRALSAQRSKFTLASKCGMYLAKNNDGKVVRVINGRPEAIRAQCEQSLVRLKTDVIDLYYLHRLDPQVPVEDSVGALSDLVRAGKVQCIGLSEVSAATLRRAHAVHPIAALQTEYSLWTRNPEIAVLRACQELGVAFVAFSPLAREFLCNSLLDLTTLATNDMRRTMPRFEPNTYKRLQAVLMPKYLKIAKSVGCTPAQLALAWLLHKAPHVLVIPGTRSVSHAQENFESNQVSIAQTDMLALEELINQHSVSEPRYAPSAQADVDTEEFH